MTIVTIWADDPGTIAQPQVCQVTVGLQGGCHRQLIALHAMGQAPEELSFEEFHHEKC